ncbi:hypothetical protein Hamer_G026502, partial [Homarus americanus]
MIVPLLHQWTKANALFKPPVINQCRTIELKLTKLWHKAVETSLGKGNLARKNEFLHTLDTLFDILTCKCSIQLCSESNCSHSGKRENNSHIDCGCPREKKIPVLELEFIKAQRTKAEGQGSMQMGSIDYSETKKQIANAKKREQIREREQKKKMKSEEAIQREEELCQDVYHFFDIPPINVNATKLSELVDLSLEVLEPPLTTSLTSQELRNLKETPMQVPKWPSHTQSVERCVKMVTEAAGHVYSHERREVSVSLWQLLNAHRAYLTINSINVVFSLEGMNPLTCMEVYIPLSFEPRITPKHNTISGHHVTEDTGFHSCGCSQLRGSVSTSLPSDVLRKLGHILGQVMVDVAGPRRSCNLEFDVISKVAVKTGGEFVVGKRKVERINDGDASEPTENQGVETCTSPSIKYDPGHRVIMGRLPATTIMNN